MKQEHEYRLEQQRLQDAQQGPGSTGGGPRTVGGGRPLHPKSLRGGGGGGINRSFNYADGNTGRTSSYGEEGEDGFSGLPGPSISSHSFKGGSSSNSTRGGPAQAIAVVHAEAVPEEEEEGSVTHLSAAAPVKPASKSSVFSRMLKGQK
jgi:hypothetical protein